MPETPQTPRRTRRPRNSLTPAGILEAAEATAETGLEALTIRAVAARLGASPMAIYRHFDSKDELLDALLDEVLGRMPPGRESADPLADLADFARRHRAMLAAHGWAVEGLIAHPLPGPNAIPIGEEALRILTRAGISGEPAVAYFSGILALNYGWTSFAHAKTQTTAAPSLRRV